MAVAVRADGHDLSLPPAHGPSQSPTAPTFIAQSPLSKIAIARDGLALIADAQAPSPGPATEPSRRIPRYPSITFSGA